MYKDLLVFLEPGFEGVPFKAHGAGQPGQCVGAVDVGSAWPSCFADAQTVSLCCATE